MVGLAIAGSRSDDTAAPSDPPRASAQAVAEASTSTLSPHPFPVEPAPDQPRSLVVRGWVARTSEAVQVVVFDRSGSTVAIGAIDPTGKPRNGMVPFETAFQLSRAGLDPAIPLYVTAANGRGLPLADARRQVVQGAVVELVIR